MLKRIIGSVIMGFIVIIGITIFVAIISQPFVSMFVIPRWERLDFFGQNGDGGLWFLIVAGSYIAAGGIGTFLAGFFVGREKIDFNQQCTESVISGLLIVFFGYVFLLAKLEFDIFLIFPTVGVLSALGGCRVGKIYDEYHRRINIIGGVVFLTALIVGIGVISPMRKLPFGCPPSCDGIDLSNQDLIQADFSNASLRGANFSGANLSRAWFWGADLFDANFTNAITVGTHFDGATMPDGKIYPSESDADTEN